MVARTGDLETIRQKVAEYAKSSLTGEPSYLTQSADGRFLTVVDVSADGDKHCANISLAVRVLPNFLVIEHDTNNKPLVDALVQAGIPRKKIILAYAGESVPPTA